MTLTRDEMVAILEEIARTGPASARISAVKTLIRLEEGDEIDDDEFERRLIQRK